MDAKVARHCEGLFSENLKFRVAREMPVAVANTDDPELLVHEGRLIHRGTLGLEASVSGLAERYSRGQTSHTVHVWWARRPHSAMRSLVYETLCRETDAQSFKTAADLALFHSDSAAVSTARAAIARSYPSSSPCVLDMFGGGGTIPSEAALLGAKAFSIDYNALSVFIQKSNLEFSQKALRAIGREALTSLVDDVGRSLLDEVKRRTDDLFDRRISDGGEQKFAYFWTYRKTCCKCGNRFHLSKRPWLSRKAGRSVGLRPAKGKDDATERVELFSGCEGASFAAWGMRGNGATCPNCGHKEKPSIQDCEEVITAIGTLKSPSGKSFHSPADTDIPARPRMAARERDLLAELSIEIPMSRLPIWSGIVNPSLYGLTTHGEIFNPRQRVVMLELIRALRNAHDGTLSSYGEDVAAYVTSALSSLLDQYIDWNCRLSMWISQNEQVGRAFCGPGVSMLWDYVETDPLLTGPANLWDKHKRIVAAVKALPVFDHQPVVMRGKAQHLPFQANALDAIITDPPYYDNIFYNVLADFFYSWKRVALGPIYPDLFQEGVTDSDDELVASSFRIGNPDAAHQWYCEELGKALTEANRVLKQDGILSFVYSHSSIRGWHAVITAFRQSGLVIDTVEPLSIERRQRPRAMTSEAVNTCVVLVASKRQTKPRELTTAELNARISADIASYGKALQDAGWSGADIGTAILARAASQIANAPQVVGGRNDLEVLADVGKIVSQHYPEFKLQQRRSL